MSPRGALVFSLLATLCALGSLSHQAGAQTLRLRAERPVAHAETATSPWTGALRYSVLTDYADDRMPRGYTHSVVAGLGYSINNDWSINATVGGRAELFNGQIDKGEEQSYGQTVGAFGELSVDYGHEFAQHRIGFGLSGSPTMDEVGHQEGQKGVLGANGELKLRFFEKAYTITQTLEAGSILNETKYSIDGTINPDYYYSYKLDNSFRFFETYKLSLVFGVKTTRFLDGFWGYSYSNGIRVSKAWKTFSAALGYENGGFTDDGEVRLWYIDQYRRIGKLSMIYEF